MNANAPGLRPFYKYASPETACAVLQSKMIRYSSPLTFNDPFDVQSGLHFNFEISDLPQKIIARLCEIAASPTEPLVDSDDVWGRLVLYVRQKYPTHGFPIEFWKRQVLGPFSALVGVIQKTQADYREHWRTELLPSLRVFCVAEEKNNLLMWAHYAKDHTGVAFEFWSLPAEDNPLSVAEPVQYCTSPPSFFSETEFIDDLFSIKKLDFKSLYRRYASYKSNDWAYEREWRVWYPLSKSIAYDDMPIRESEFRAIYLGCRMNSDMRTKILALIRESFPKTRIFQAMLKEQAYELEYVEL